MIDFLEALRDSLEVKRIEYPVQDMCACSECGWSRRTEDALLEADSDGWENPTYYYHACPELECFGTIEEYWSSVDSLADFYIQEIHDMADKARKDLGLV